MTTSGQRANVTAQEGDIMTKKEIKTSSNNELIMETILTYSSLLSNYQQSRGTTQLEKHFDDLSSEMLRRDLLTQEQIDRLNS